MSVNFAIIHSGMKLFSKGRVPYLGGWVYQDGDNIHKKTHAFKIHF